MYTWHVRLIHHEATTHQHRIPRADFELASHHYRPWLIDGDPYFNPNLDYASPTPRLRQTVFDNGFLNHLSAMRRLPHKDIIVVPDDML